MFNSSDTDIQEMVNNMPSLEKPGVERARAKKELVNSPIYRDLIVSSDGKTAALLLSLVEDKKFNRLLKLRDDLRSKRHQSSLSARETRALEDITAEYDQVNESRNLKRSKDIARIRNIIAPYRQYGVLHLGGLPMITDDMVTFVRNDLIVFGGGVLAFLIIILTAIFRKIRWITLPLISCFYSASVMIGILGLIDVAKLLGMPDYEKEDYGQSIAKMGIGPGCYLVLPVLGPSTVRDTTASFANFIGGDAWYNVTVNNDTQYFSDFDYYASRVTSGIDFRAKNYDSIENLEKNSLDFYASVKSLYLQDRQQKILNSKKIVETQNDSDWEEIETQ